MRGGEVSGKTVWLTFADGKGTFVRDVTDIEIKNGVMYLTDCQRNGVDRHVEIVDRGAYVLANLRSWNVEDAK
jgi:hypothetical protein